MLGTSTVNTQHGPRLDLLLTCVSKMTLAFLRVLALASVAAAQALIDMRYSWPYTGPYRVDSQTGSRGRMQGYNIVRTRCLRVWPSVSHVAAAALTLIAR